MPSVSDLPRVAARRIDETSIRLTSGREVFFTDVPGTEWDSMRVAAIQAMLQAEIDREVIVASLPPRDVDFEATDEDLRRRYGGRRFYSDDRTKFIDRSTLVTVRFERPDRRGVMARDLILTFTEVV